MPRLNFRLFASTFVWAWLACALALPGLACAQASLAQPMPEAPGTVMASTAAAGAVAGRFDLVLLDLRMPVILVTHDRDFAGVRALPVLLGDSTSKA